MMSKRLFSKLQYFEDLLAFSYKNKRIKYVESMPFLFVQNIDYTGGCLLIVRRDMLKRDTDIYFSTAVPIGCFSAVTNCTIFSPFYTDVCR